MAVRHANKIIIKHIGVVGRSSPREEVFWGVGAKTQLFGEGRSQEDPHRMLYTPIQSAPLSGISSAEDSSLSSTLDDEPLSVEPQSQFFKWTQDWNEAILNGDQDGYEQATIVGEQFMQTVESVGAVLMTEHNVPDDEKIIPPIDIGKYTIWPSFLRQK